MAPPWRIPDEATLPGAPLRNAKRRRSLPGGLTGNALFTGIISAVVAGVISFYVAHWQSRDAARQAIASQQVAVTVQLEAAANTFY